MISIIQLLHSPNKALDLRDHRCASANFFLYIPASLLGGNKKSEMKSIERI